MAADGDGLAGQHVAKEVVAKVARRGDAEHVETQGIVVHPAYRGIGGDGDGRDVPVRICFGDGIGAGPLDGEGVLAPGIGHVRIGRYVERPGDGHRHAGQAGLDGIPRAVDVLVLKDGAKEGEARLAVTKVHDIGLAEGSGDVDRDRVGRGRMVAGQVGLDDLHVAGGAHREAVLPVGACGRAGATGQGDGHAGDAGLGQGVVDTILADVVKDDAKDVAYLEHGIAKVDGIRLSQIDVDGYHVGGGGMVTCEGGILLAQGVQARLADLERILAIVPGDGRQGDGGAGEGDDHPGQAGLGSVPHGVGVEVVIDHAVDESPVGAGGVPELGIVGGDGVVDRDVEIVGGGGQIAGRVLLVKAIDHRLVVRKGPGDGEGKGAGE